MEKKAQQETNRRNKQEAKQRKREEEERKRIERARKKVSIALFLFVSMGSPGVERCTHQCSHTFSCLLL